MDGHGTVVTFKTSNFTARLIDVDGPSIERDALDDTYMDTLVAKEFTPAALYDGGEVTLTIKHNVGALPPVTGTTESIEVNWAGTGNKWTFNAFVTGYSGGAQIGSRMEGKLKIKVSGAVVVSAAPVEG